MTSLLQNEVLSTALDGFVRAQLRAAREATVEAFRAEIRASNVLLDACLDCGMSHDEPVVEHWAAERVARFLVEA